MPTPATQALHDAANNAEWAIYGGMIGAADVAWALGIGWLIWRGNAGKSSRLLPALAGGAGTAIAIHFGAAVVLGSLIGWLGPFGSLIAFGLFVIAPVAWIRLVARDALLHAWPGRSTLAGSIAVVVALALYAALFLALGGLAASCKCFWP